MLPSERMAKQRAGGESPSNTCYSRKRSVRDESRQDVATLPSNYPGIVYFQTGTVMKASGNVARRGNGGRAVVRVAE